MAIMRTMKGGKSNFHMSARSMKPSCGIETYAVRR